ncbi:DDE superfamily endonuclease [Popillia japonica]|uniref:DDE superfamily endonuclease n=1 Tax=Popillia japonica TaxID=7064 RepID=A0AAW1I8L3_POPJA
MRTAKDATLDDAVFLWFTWCRFRKDNNKSGKVLLFLSNAPSHPSAEILNSLDDNFKIMFLPPNVTAILQPMDRGVIEKLKKRFKKQVLRRLPLSENDCESVVAFAKRLHLKDSCHMLADAWDSLTVTNLQNAWKKLWPVVEAGETKDAKEWLNNDTNLTGCTSLSDDDIVKSVNEDCPSDNDSDETNQDVNDTGPTHAEAFTALDTALTWYTWYERQAESCSTQLLLLKRVRDLAAAKRCSTIMQRKISDYFH